jgi:hypothetical protein
LIPAIGLAIGATIGALWLAAAWWAYRDASRRAGSSFVGLLAAAWIVLSSPFLLPLALAVYGLARPQHTAAEHRSRRLIAELVNQLDATAAERCPTCALDIDSTWLRCPSCATWLAQPCANCGGWSERDLDVCPWCGSEERDAPAVETQVTEPVTVARKRRGRQAPRKVAAAAAAAARDQRDPRRPVPVMAEGRGAVPARAR